MEWILIGMGAAFLALLAPSSTRSLVSYELNWRRTSVPRVALFSIGSDWFRAPNRRHARVANQRV